MENSTTKTQNNIFVRILLIIGLFKLLSNATFLIGYYLLPEGFLRESPFMTVGEIVADTETFWSEFCLTALLNICLITIVGVSCNLQRVRDFPVSYIIPVSLGISSGVIAGTNSFISSDLAQYSVRDGLALGLSIGEVEMLAYIMIIGATANISIYQYRNLLDLKPTRIKRFRDIRLTRPEIFCLILAFLMLAFAAYRESVNPLL